MHLTTAEKIERLDNLERVVRALPRGDLDMDKWTCGTTRCALGAAMYDPWFHERGLVLGGKFEPYHYPKFRSEYGYDAGAAFFGIPMRDTEHLFNPECYPPHARERGIRPSDVVKRIRSLKKRIQKEAASNG